MAVLGKAEITISDILDGKNGIGIKSTTITYQAGTSGTTAPTGTWSSTVPSVPQGQYLWSKTVITYTDNTTSTTYSVAYIPKNGQNGATGGTGATGTGVESIVQQYYLSTSKTSQTGGSWVTSMPTWSSGKYLWTRYQINYKNPTSVAYTSPICDSSWEAVNEIQVGGRNLVLKSDVYYKNANYTTAQYKLNSVDSLKEGDIVTIQIKGLLGADKQRFDVYSNAGNVKVTSIFKPNDKGIYTATTAWTYRKYDGTLVTPNGDVHIYAYPSGGTSESSIDWIKIEKGNKPTDWSPAPEDMATSDQVSETKTRLDILNNMISSLVTDGNGSSLMTQTGDGWTFNIGEITNQINQATKSLSDLTGNVEQVNNIVNNVDGIVNDVIKKTAYITLATDSSGNPCIELGKEGNPFKVRITNTSIDFIDNNIIVAYVNNNSLYIESAVIKNELKIGDGAGYVWKRRSNGNLGLRYSG